MEGYSYSSRLKYLMACGSAIVYPNKRYTEFWCAHSLPPIVIFMQG